ncbi:MAG: TonB-dependent receptor domain-containing protein, partial [Campylobacteraceae bacterium]
KISAKTDVGNHEISLSAGYSESYLTNGLRMYNTTSQSWNPWTKAFGISEGEQDTFTLNIADNIQYDNLLIGVAAGYEFVHRKVKSNVNSAAYNTLIPSQLLNQVIRKDTDEKDHLFNLGLTAEYRVNDSFIPYMKLSSAQRTPYFNEQYGNNPNTGVQIPNQDLKNEKVYGVDVGFNGEYSDFYYSATSYYQYYKDYIELVLTGYNTNAGLPIRQFQNLDEATILGVEAMVGYKITNNIFSEIKYMYTYGKNEDDNQPLAYIAPQKLSLSLYQGQEYGFNWGVEELLVSKQNKISQVGGEIKSSGYALTNLYANYKFKNLWLLNDFTIGLEINNLFDKKYREHLTTVSSTAFYRPDEVGINAALTFKAKF